jgi:drug/metabolite transporter (DMT)-like permease
MLPVILGVLTLVSVVVLLAWDVFPGLFPSDAHSLLGALPLALIAVAYLFYQTVRRPGRAEAFKAVLLAIAFLFWAANQFWPESPRATLYNDLAIALFVLDVFFVLVGWPTGSPDESFAESYAETPQEKH